MRRSASKAAVKIRSLSRSRGVSSMCVVYAKHMPIKLAQVMHEAIHPLFMGELLFNNLTFIRGLI